MTDSIARTSNPATKPLPGTVAEFANQLIEVIALLTESAATGATVSVSAASARVLLGQMNALRAMRDAARADLNEARLAHETPEQWTSIMPQESEADVIQRLRLWAAFREPAPLVKYGSVKQVIRDALKVMDAMLARRSPVESTVGECPECKAVGPCNCGAKGRLAPTTESNHG